MILRKNDKAPANPRRRRLWLGALGLVLLAVSGVGVVEFATPLMAGPSLTQLVVRGRLRHVAPAGVRAALQPFAGSGFFRVDMEAVNEAVRQLPWVAQASVRREWPHTLYISLVEEVPVARWDGDGLLDAQGRVFAQFQSTDPEAEAYAKLPLLEGDGNAAADVLGQYNTLLALVEPRGLAITHLAVDGRGAATVTLDDGIEVRLGREEAAARLARFAAVALPALGSRLAHVAYVDMRYTNGFAVGWKSPTAGNAGTGGQKPNV